ncbi:MAG TPA: hypothetical protein VKW09_12930 [bacterium]|nr:hypothetical protein [bacterium]
MKHPHVYAIYWGSYFERDPGRAAVKLMDRFFKDILSSSFMNALRQYGVEVEHAAFVGSKVVSDRAPQTLIDEGVSAQLKAWFRAETVPEPHRGEERNWLYVIFLPEGTTFGGVEPPRCACGDHGHGVYGEAPEYKPLFWAVIQEWHNHEPLPKSDREFVDSCSWCVSHEMVESFTNPGGDGYQTADGCEIGDICECAKGSNDQKAPIIKAPIQVGDNCWYVETYWDNENSSCYPLHIVPRDQAPVRYYELPGERARSRG